MSRETFDDLMREVAGTIAGKPFDDNLEKELNDNYGIGTGKYEAIKAACEDGIEEGWLCENENNGLRYGRPIKPSPETRDLSVDVVKYKDLKGPYHAHPNGEVCLVMPTEGDAKFDGNGAGWCVYEPGSGHYPTISDGEAIVLYLLPEGAIDFKAKPAA